MKFLIALALFSAIALGSAEILYDFQNEQFAISYWYERSDVQFRNGAGASKADFVILDKDSGKEAVFFALANAVDYSVGRAAYIVEDHWDLSAYTTFQINCRAIAAEGTFYIAFRNNCVVDGPRNTVYVAELNVKASSEFETIEIPISDFKVVDPVGAKALDTTDITSIAIALHANTGEINVGILEISWIGAY